MLMKGVTLRGLEIFEALAKTGSVAQASQQTGLSQPAVSQQLKNLESALKTTLIDHSKRPMQLTQAGHSFLTHAEAVLSQLRMAQAELTSMDLAHLSDLSIGMIDDFDNDVTPRLATILAKNLTRCRFKLITASSYDIHAALASKALHLAVSASTGVTCPDILELPLVRDPFILVTPRAVLNGPPAALDALNALPFLRYDSAQLIGGQIDAWLGRQNLEFPTRFEVGSHMALMAMVARGIGWAISTPLGYMRAARFHHAVEAHPLPQAPFSRTISLFAGADWAGAVPADISGAAARLIDSHMIEPCLRELPWLKGDFRLLKN